MSPRWLTAQALLLLALVATVCITYGGWGWQHETWRAPLDYPGRGDGASLDLEDFTPAEVCGACHKQHYEEWKGSAMGNSLKNAEPMIELFETGLDLRGAPAEDVEFCLECHAPLALVGTLDLDRKRPLSREGVTCDVCHTVTAVHAGPTPAEITWDPKGPRRGPLSADEAISAFHETAQSPLFANSELCAGCHLSSWPSTGVPLDFTWQEWADSPWPQRGYGCASCHMATYQGSSAPDAPERTLHRHDFPGGGDPALVRSAAQIEVKAVDEEVVVTVVNNGTGHALPTGNGSYPVVILTLRALDEAGTEVYVDTREYGLTFVDGRGVPTTDPTVAVEVASDTTLQPMKPRFERFEVPKTAVRVEAELVHHRYHPRIHDQQAMQLEYGRRYLSQGIQLHKLPEHLGTMKARMARIRSLPPLPIDEASLDL